MTPLTGGAAFLGNEQASWAKYAFKTLAKPLGLKITLVLGDTPAEQGVEGAGGHLEGDVVQRGERAEALGHPEDLDAERAAGLGHASPFTAAMKSADGATAPNTPPCIVTILIAAR